MKRWETLGTGASLHRYAVPGCKLFVLRCADDTQRLLIDALRCADDTQLFVLDVYGINEHCPSSDDLYVGQMVVNCTDMRNAAVSWLRDDVPADLATRILDWLDSAMHEPCGKPECGECGPCDECHGKGYYFITSRTREAG